MHVFISSVIQFDKSFHLMVLYENYLILYLHRYIHIDVRSYCQTDQNRHSNKTIHVQIMKFACRLNMAFCCTWSNIASTEQSKIIKKEEKRPLKPAILVSLGNGVTDDNGQVIYERQHTVHVNYLSKVPSQKLLVLLCACLLRSLVSSASLSSMKVPNTAIWR